MSKSEIYVVNTTSGTAIANGGTYAPSTIVRRYGQCCQMGSNGVIVKSVGYYDVDATVTVEAGAAGAVTATLYQDGTPVVGATTTITAAANDTVTLPISAVVRNSCGCKESVLTIVVSGQTTTSVNLAMIVEKE